MKTLIHSSSSFATVSVSPTIALSATELPLATIPFLSPSQRLSRLPHFASAALLFRPFSEPLAFVAARLRGLIGLPVLILPTTLLHLLVLNGLGGADPFAVLPRPAALMSSSVLEGPTQMVSPGLDVELSPSALATVPPFALRALFRPARTPSSTLSPSLLCAFERDVVVIPHEETEGCGRFMIPFHADISIQNPMDTIQKWSVFMRLSLGELAFGSSFQQG